jgi:hypothetical protein
MTAMKKRRFTEEQSLGLRRQAEALIQSKEACPTGGFSDATL